MNKKAIFIMPEYALGGAEAQERLLIEALDNAGYNIEVYILNMFGINNDDSLKSAREQYDKVKFVELKMPNRSLYEYREAIRDDMRRRYVESNPSVAILFHEYTVPLIPFLHSLNIKTIYSERLDAVWITTEPLFTKSLQSCDVLTCNSLPAKQKMEEVFGRTVYEIKNGKKIRELELKRKTNQIYNIIVPCRICRVKNQKVMLKMLSYYPEMECHVKLVGEIEDNEYYNELKEDLKRYHIGDRVEFVGYTSNMQEEYDWADLLVLPSLQEGTPNVVLEAFANGLPVVVSDIDAEHEIVKNEKLRFQAYDEHDLKNAIDYVCSMSQDDLLNMIQANYEFVKSAYSVDKMTSSFIGLADELLIKSVNYNITDYDVEHDEFVRLIGEYGKRERLNKLLMEWMNKKQVGHDFALYFVQNGWKRIAIYGYRGIGGLLYNELKNTDVSVEAIIDRSANALQASELIITPDKAGEYLQDVIVVAVIDEFESIRDMLRQVCDCEIVSLSDVIENY